MSIKTRLKVTGLPVTLTPVAVPVAWESLTVLQDLVTNAADGAVIDLEGRLFSVSPGVTKIIDTDNQLTIKNGVFCGAWRLAWATNGLGQVECTVNPGEIADPTALLIDRDATFQPRLAVWPKPPAGQLAFPADANSNWIVVTTLDNSVTNGVVHTEAGDNVVASLITGFQITDATVKAQIDAAIGGLSAPTLSCLHHAGPNAVKVAQVISWDGATGIMVLNATETLIYNNYMEFSLSGNEAFITLDGDYVYNKAANKVTYKPVGSTGLEAMISILPIVWRSSSGANLRFENMEIFGGDSNSTAAGLYTRLDGGAIPTVFDNCFMHSGAAAIRGLSTCTDCRFERFIDRAISTEDGGRVERCTFKEISRSSAILVQCTGSGVQTVPVRQTIVRDCSFDMPSCIHGQGLALYANSWQNALVEHNLFINCRRVLAFQPLNEKRTTEGVMRFENNLVVYDQATDGITTGQQGIAFNKDADTHLDSTQEVYFRSNTEIINPNIYLGGDSGRWTMEIAKLQESTVTVENNFCGAISASAQDVVNFPARVPHKRANNLLVLDSNYSYGAAHGETDSAVAVAYNAGLLDYPTLQLQGAASTSASDGGSPGIRWANSPTLAQALNPPADWYTQWPAQAIPTAASYSYAWLDQDLR